MRRALQAVLSRRALILPQSSCNLDHHYSHRALNRLLYSTSPRLLPQKPTTFNITYPKPAHDSGPNTEYDGHWVKLIKEVVEGQSSSLCPVNCTGSVAYRTCYSACDSTRWNLFRQEFDRLILKKWEAQAKHGVDPDGARFLWKLWWFDADEGADMTSLNIKFADVPGIGDNNPSHHMDPDLNPTHAFFLLVNEEVIASVLEGPAKGEIPFVYVVDTHSWPPYEPDEDEIEDEIENGQCKDEDYKGYLKVAVELYGEFWYFVSTGHFGMEELAPSDEISKDMFTESIM
ncbi:uncharacterized protein EAE98_008632 [Botrytis deweyae]|uniref:Uncharacterized protein n=1 Tax=Botrytis deweyae TaxID=2478750 RepID=A0ABQ7IE39_9HELO|nr:uncharacterized protein EAE98_008632 [Botrytis deweyae]KAF7921206.1 hypothetical protein EAE98_008632 [Botrytis deweyae]